MDHQSRQSWPQASPDASHSQENSLTLPKDTFVSSYESKCGTRLYWEKGKISVTSFQTWEEQSVHKRLENFSLTNFPSLRVRSNYSAMASLWLLLNTAFCSCHRFSRGLKDFTPSCLGSSQYQRTPEVVSGQVFFMVVKDQIPAGTNDMRGTCTLRCKLTKLWEKHYHEDAARAVGYGTQDIDERIEMYRNRWYYRQTHEYTVIIQTEKRTNRYYRQKLKDKQW